MVLVYLKNLLFPSRASDVEAADARYSRVDRARNSLSNESHGPHDFSTITESYFTRIDPRVISDATIGLSDGLTVPFALTAGLSALGDSKIVISGGLAELIAGAISMGLGGWLAARSEADAYQTLLRSTSELVHGDPEYANSLLRQSLAPLASFITLENLNIPTNTSNSSTSPNLLQPHNPPDNEKSTGTTLVELLMRYHHCAPAPPARARAHISALTIATAYFGGGFIPLAPYFFVSEVGRAFWWSVAVMGVALGCFGAAKTWLTSTSIGDCRDRSAGIESHSTMRIVVKIATGACQMILLGSLAAAAATGLVIAFKEGYS